MSEPLDLVGAIVRRWILVAAALVVGVGAAALYIALAPKWYAATLTVVPSQKPQDVATASLAAKMPGAFDSFATDVQRIQAVLNSNSVADELIAKFDLKRRYDVEHIEQARIALWKHCGTTADRKSGVVALTCEDKEPQVAKDIAAFFGDVGNRVFGRISSSSAREERRFLETQVTKARKDVEESSRKLREFQEKHKIVDLPEQSKAVISAMASIKGELVSKQLELSYLSSFSARTESSVVQLQQKIAILESKLKQLEASQQATPPNGSASGSANFFPDAMNVPELRFELEGLMREQKIQETVFFLLTQRFEMAKVDEARDTSTFQILDYPTLPTYAARPRIKRTLAAGAAAGLGLGAALALLPYLLRRRRAVA